MGTARLGRFGALKAPVEPEAWTMGVAARAVAPRSMTKRTGIRDQGDAGACTGFGEGATLAIVHGLGFIPASGALYFFNKRESGFPDSVDSGAYMLPSAQAALKYGIGSEALWPYKPENYSVEPSDEYKVQALDHRVKAFYRAPTVAQLKTALSIGLPGFSAFDVPASFREVGATGMWVDRGGRAVGGHAICIEGYDDDISYGSDSSAKGCFVVQNSWGPEWGTNHPDDPAGGTEGFFLLPYYAYEGSRWWDSIIFSAWDLEAGS